MTFLDRKPPLDFSDPAVRGFRDRLAETYRSEAEIRQLLDEVNVPAGHINFGGGATVIWHSALRAASNSGTLRALFEHVASQSPAVFSDLLGNADRAPSPAREWQPSDEGIEKILAAKSTLFDIGFLRRGLEVAKGVFRIKAPGGFGTAFRVGPDLILSAHHVFFETPQSKAPNHVTLRFDYEESYEHSERQYGVRKTFGRLAKKPKQDWCMAKLDEELPPEVPTLEFSRFPPQENELAYIIQHPGASPKQIALYRNLIRYVDEEVVQYISDTAKGSSGAPVFDEHWRVIALHFGWVTPDEQEEADPATGSFDRNQGMRVEIIQQKLKELLGEG